MKYFCYLFLFTALISSCSTEAFSEDMQKGFDLAGNPKSCKAMPSSTVCTMVYTESDNFAARCRKEGFKATQCGCHDYICSKKLATADDVKTGYDMEGKKRSCVEFSVAACTRILTESDRYKAECLKRGLKVYSCDCHDHLCSKYFKWKQ